MNIIKFGNTQNQCEKGPLNKLKENRRLKLLL